MSDISISVINNCFDLEINDDSNDLIGDNGLETAVTISLFTDKRVNEDEVPFGKSSKRGWWGDMFPEVDQDRIGSKLWTLEPEKTTEETLNRAREYSEDALEWLIDDGIASAINVTCTYNEYRHLIIEVDITKPGSDEIERFSVVWDGQEIKRS